MIQYLVQINYKSGQSMNFWCKEFEIKYDGSLRWVAANTANHPLSIASELSDVESIWQIDSREVPDEIPLPLIEE